MRQTELLLSEEDRSIVEVIRAKRLRHSREINRAHVLSCLDRGIPESQVMAVLEPVARQEHGLGGVSRETVRRMLKMTSSTPGVDACGASAS